MCDMFPERVSQGHHLEVQDLEAQDLEVLSSKEVTVNKVENDAARIDNGKVVVEHALRK